MSKPQNLTFSDDMFYFLLVPKYHLGTHSLKLQLQVNDAMLAGYPGAGKLELPGKHSQVILGNEFDRSHAPAWECIPGRSSVPLAPGIDRNQPITPQIIGIQAQLPHRIFVQFRRFPSLAGTLVQPDGFFTSASLTRRAYSGESWAT